MRMISLSMSFILNFRKRNGQLNRSQNIVFATDCIWPCSDIRCIWVISCNICRGSRSKTSAPYPRDRSRRWQWTAPWTTTAVVAAVAAAAGPAIADAPVARMDTTPRPSHRSGLSPARFVLRDASNSSSLSRFVQDHFLPLKTSLFMLSLDRPLAKYFIFNLARFLIRDKKKSSNFCSYNRRAFIDACLKHL